MTDQTKQAYRGPSLVNYGSISKLTQGAGSGGDAGGGGAGAGGGASVGGVMIMLMADLPTTE